VQSLSAFVLGIILQFNDNSGPTLRKEDIQEIILSRIGEDQFLQKLQALRDSEAVRNNNDLTLVCFFFFFFSLISFELCSHSSLAKEKPCRRCCLTRTLSSLCRPLWVSLIAHLLLSTHTPCAPRR